MDKLTIKHKRFLKAASKLLGTEQAWRKLAARPQSGIAKHLIEACDIGNSPKDAIESYWKT